MEARIVKKHVHILPSPPSYMSLNQIPDILVPILLQKRVSDCSSGNDDPLRYSL